MKEMLIPMEFKNWSNFAKKIEAPKTKREIIKDGILILRHKQKKVEGILENAEHGSIAGHKAAIINAPLWQSEIGHHLYTHKAPVAIIWWRRQGKIVVSLRSDKTVDVAKIAESFGGGGHPASAAFTLPEDDFKTILSFYKKA